jgi:molybdopterin converting factor small subunit
MRVRVTFLGILAEYTGLPHLELEMGKGASVRDLLLAVGGRFSTRFPKQVWNAERECFGPMIGVFLDQRDVEDEDTPLQEGSEVILLPMMAGG